MDTIGLPVRCIKLNHVYEVDGVSTAALLDVDLTVMEGEAVAVLGPDSLLSSGSASGRWAHALMATRANSIMGGTSEIQRNIIGERVLGLPREPR